MSFVELEAIRPYFEDMTVVRQQRATRATNRECQLVEENLALVVSLALKHSSTSTIVDLGDLIQAGNVALIRAAQRYQSDHESRAAFSSFAGKLITQAIRQELKMDYLALNVDPYQVTLLYRLLSVQRHLEAELQREPTEEELAEPLGLTPQDVRELLLLHDRFQRVSRLDEPVLGEESLTLAEIVEDPSASVEDIAEEMIRNDTLKQLLATLSREERQVILGRYSFYGKQETYGEIAARLKKSVEWVHRREEIAMLKLQRYAADLHLQDFVA